MLAYKNIEVSDIPELGKLYIETFNAPPWNDAWTEETVRKRLHQMICVEDFYGLCTYQDGELYGMILGCFEQFYDGKVFNIREFCVSNRLRGKGIGTEILGHFEEELKRMEAGKIILYTSKGEQTEHFYHKQGFYNIDGLILMGKKLDGCLDII